MSAVAEDFLGYELIQGEDRELALLWRNAQKQPHDLSTAAFEVKVGKPGKTAEFVKTTGIVGAATDPNVVITFETTGEINTIDPGLYVVQVKATITGRDIECQVPLVVKPAVL